MVRISYALQLAFPASNAARTHLQAGVAVQRRGRERPRLGRALAICSSFLIKTNGFLDFRRMVDIIIPGCGDIVRRQPLNYFQETLIREAEFADSAPSPCTVMRVLRMQASPPANTSASSEPNCLRSSNCAFHPRAPPSMAVYLRLCRRDTQHQARPNLARHSQIEHPYFASVSSWHCRLIGIHLPEKLVGSFQKSSSEMLPRRPLRIGEESRRSLVLLGNGQGFESVQQVRRPVLISSLLDDKNKPSLPPHPSYPILCRGILAGNGGITPSDRLPRGTELVQELNSQSEKLGNLRLSSATNPTGRTRRPFLSLSHLGLDNNRELTLSHASQRRRYGTRTGMV